MKFNFLELASLISLCCFVSNVELGALQLNSQNMDQILEHNELVFVNYYANWCRFSQQLEPTYDEFADKLSKEDLGVKVVIGKVDCDVETQIAQKNQINKYPTLKLYRFGTTVKKEFRGPRTVDAFISFIKEQVANPLKTLESHTEYNIALFDLKKRTIVGNFENKDRESFKVFNKLASILRDSCSFVAGVGEVYNAKQLTHDLVSFRDVGSNEHDESTYTGDINNYEVLYSWANEKCTPLVREITFENAEELTEEGLPFLILFHRPDETDSIVRFQEQVKRQLVHLKHTINAVHADGLKFSHPLQHLGKSSSDLPVLAIDSFRHMYLFPDYSKLGEGDALLQFVQDLHSGKLHREFHNGPDPTTAPPVQAIEGGSGSDHLPKTIDNNVQKQKPSTPPESVFVKLAPSRERYSLKQDGEL